MCEIKIKEIPLETALRWERELGVVGILASYPPRKALGAFIDDRLVGAVTTCGEWIVGVVVDLAFQRRGIGKALFLEAFCLLRERVAAVRVQPCSAGGWALVNSLPPEVHQHLYVKEDVW